MKNAPRRAFTPAGARWFLLRGVYGTIEITQPGEQLVTVCAKAPATGKAINLRAVRLQAAQ